MKDREKRGFFQFVSPSLVFLIVMVIFPLVYSFYVSLLGWYPTKPSLGVPFVGLSNYLKVARSTDFWNALRVTFLFVVCAVTVETVLGLLVAIALSKNAWGVKTIRSLLLVPMAATPVAVGIGWRYMLNESFGVVNYYLRRLGIPTKPWLSDPTFALVAVIIMDAWQWLPFAFLIILAGIQSLPIEVFESARVEGASGWQVLRFVTLPLIKPIILIAVTLRMIDALKAFDVIYAATRGGPGISTETFSLYLYRLGFRFYYTSEAAAASFIFVIIVNVLCLALFSFLEKRQEGG